MAASEKLNAYILQTPERALEAADQSDARLGTDDARPLEGLPIGVKDLFCTNRVRTTACSNILGDFTPTYESKVTENLWADGALMLGKPTMTSSLWAHQMKPRPLVYASIPWRADDEEPLVPAVLQVALPRRWPRSSGLAATATDTGGSIRQPAALTGTVGLKPTYGRCSRWGIVALCIIA